MQSFLTYFASAAADGDLPAAENGDVFGSLGIDWQLLVLQIIAFGILVIILAKFIYPQISAMLDRRDQTIENAIKAAKDAEAKAAQSEAETVKILKGAKTEASQIVQTAKKEASDLATEAEFDAKKKAEIITRSAKADIQKEIETARLALRQETLDLVATATEKVAGVKLGTDDAKLVEKTLKGGNK